MRAPHETRRGRRLTALAMASFQRHAKARQHLSVPVFTSPYDKRSMTQYTCYNREDGTGAEFMNCFDVLTEWQREYLRGSLANVCAACAFQYRGSDDAFEAFVDRAEDQAEALTKARPPQPLLNLRLLFPRDKEGLTEILKAFF